MSKCKLTIGILAHVDAGKTTLSEGMLYRCGKIRKLGRVDHGDAYLDTHNLERSRGITIFSKQARMEIGEFDVTLLDTPGHVDFAAEMERTLQVLDYAILVINGADGVQGHTRTLWKLLERYAIPTFLFINKMDQNGTDEGRLLEDLRSQLSDYCVKFGPEPILDDVERLEEVAVGDEDALEEFLETECISQDKIRQMIRERKVFPCYFGSALKVIGVDEFLDGIGTYVEKSVYSEKFGARIYKVSRESDGTRLTHMKITGGVLKVKEVLSNRSETCNGEDIWSEKVNQIRVYSGGKYEMLKEAEAGTVCAVTGLTQTRAGEGLGIEKDPVAPVLEPVLTFRVNYPEEIDANTMLGKLRELEEEDPMLRVLWNEETEELSVQLMGEVQTEILRSLVEERFGIAICFDAGSILYKETIRNKVEGVGHYEPLRHYAEVHLVLEPGEPGSGVVIDTICSEDRLDKNWQRLILTHLLEKEHRGVLVGAPITDIKLTLAAGKAHLKHTEGGDFRQATYRAVRQGLMKAESVLLEPWYAFRLEIPSANVGRALNDIQKMNGEFETPDADGDLSVIVGSAPVSEMRDYQMEVAAYSHGMGRLFCVLKGYYPCHDSEQVVESIGYNPDSDMNHPTGSVFCSHGAGYYVPWQEVDEQMHLPSVLAKEVEKTRPEVDPELLKSTRNYNEWNSETKELEEIFIRTYGKVERRKEPTGGTVYETNKPHRVKKEHYDREFLLVDGYNVIHAWDELKELAKENLLSATGKLADILCNYQGFKKCDVILVYDAYKVEGHEINVMKYHNIHIVYTKEAETADQYIEKVVHEIGRKYHVTVVTSDAVEQVIVTGQGASIISSREFAEEVEIVNRQIREETEIRRQSGKNYLFDHMDKDLAEEMEKVRLGK